ncbi:NAD(P)-dependent dehydrogenase, short-chain alcohol dehydrogenase family [Amycolatopsis marina]|uniref:NAD(P)-dependent dehydrogenase, short-chain alcohol dehydrogenase family n=1 Tax=Amycolatopsis marina TaxID=490629 RepID=A0A1I0YID1_9PSEU|nr:SDR family oxidoreductase [Amycolatopsis marina]SFB12516.1 NAD(P)-dependent dehydrogenase, short-chain alcohol dehydrogenase family [Amycolatopsis marina]
MTGVLDGKVALVTGGSRGIGAAIAIRLGEQGADVVLTYQHSADQAGNVVESIKAHGRRALAVRADNADADAVAGSVRAALGEFGRLDILVNNAGVGHYGVIEDISQAELDHVIAVNVRAPFLATQAAVPHLSDGGRVITIGSIASERAAVAGFSLYGLSKAALTGLTKALGRELGPRGITVNLVQPGPIDTDMNPADGPGADGQREFVALGAHGQPSDIAATVAHLAGETGRYITATAIAVDGGHAA